MSHGAVPAVRRLLPQGQSHFLVAMPDTAQVCGKSTTEVGPFKSVAEAADAIPFYELVLREHLEPRVYVALRFRVVTSQTRRPPHSCAGSILHRRQHGLPRRDPRGRGFTDFGEALWVYGLVIDHVATRLEYLEEELFNGLSIEIEDWEPREVDSVWISIAVR